MQGKEKKQFSPFLWAGARPRYATGIRICSYTAAIQVGHANSRIKTAHVFDATAACVLALSLPIH
jgi:hypothetical protein